MSRRPQPLVIDPGSVAHKILLALRPGGPVEYEQLANRANHSVGSILIHLDRAGYVERCSAGETNRGATWRITAAGRAACPPRRGTYTDFPDFSTKPIGDLS